MSGILMTKRLVVTSDRDQIVKRLREAAAAEENFKEPGAFCSIRIEQNGISVSVSTLDGIVFFNIVPWIDVFDTEKNPLTALIEQGRAVFKRSRETSQ